MAETDIVLSTPIKHQTLNDIVYEDITKRIADLVIKPGDQLLEHRLAAELGVSKSPVREALRRLEKTGLICGIAFKGCFVSHLSVEEFKEAMEFRRLLEIHCFSVSFAHYSYDDVRKIKELETAADKSFKEGDKEMVSDFQSDLHKFIVKKAGNKLIEKTYNDLLYYKLKRYLVFALREVSEQSEIWREQHRRIFKAIERQDCTAALNALDQHLTSILNLFDEDSVLP
jgi:DNA-binding GntR family transcriptional regulator